MSADMALLNRSGTQKTQKSTTTAATATSSFLPELNSTPPMPTFQKPDMGTPTPTRKLEQSDLETEDITPTRGRQLGFVSGAPANVMLSIDAFVSRRSLNDLPMTADAEAPLVSDMFANFASGDRTNRSPASTNASRVPLLARVKPKATTALKDRIGETPPLPKGWNSKHDYAIVYLDVFEYGLSEIVKKMRTAFPELCGILTPAMIDKRFRQLDQDVLCDYWRRAMIAKEEKDTERKEHRKKKQRETSHQKENHTLKSAPSTMTLTGLEADGLHSENKAASSTASLRHVSPST